MRRGKVALSQFAGRFSVARIKEYESRTAGETKSFLKKRRKKKKRKEAGEPERSHAGSTQDSNKPRARRTLARHEEERQRDQ